MFFLKKFFPFWSWQASVLGPLWLIKKRIYVLGILMTLLQFFLPIFIIVFMLYFYSDFFQELKTVKISELLRFLIPTTYYKFILQPYIFFPYFFCFSLFHGFFAKLIYEKLKKKQEILFEIISDDNISTVVTFLGFFCAFIAFISSGVPFEHAYFPEVIYKPYAYQEAISLLDGSILFGFFSVTFTLIYQIFIILRDRKKFTIYN